MKLLTELDSRLDGLLNSRVLQACCSNRESERYPVNLDALTMGSLLLVELVSPDVMYNGLPWPDEEFTKVCLSDNINKTVAATLITVAGHYRKGLANP